MPDELGRWAAGRAPELLARAEAEAVVALRDALVEAALRRRREPEAAPARPPRRDRPATGDALWTYCVMRAGEPAPEGATGVEGASLARVESGDLAAVVSRVPLDEFGEEPLRDNLNDIAWLERVARAHEGVLEAALGAGTIVPLRMCTIYESEAGVRRMLQDERESLAGALDLLDGRQEWGVKLLVDPEKLAGAARARADESGQLDAELADSTEAGAYMLRRRFERETRELADGLAAEVADDVHSRLQAWATEAITLPPQNRDLSHHEGDMLLNGAYLVAADRVDGLRELVAELGELHRPLGARLELTGPWPPYNFVPRGGAAAIT
jgi:Gas vesicle synthesis protein GvpL/GvpF